MRRREVHASSRPVREGLVNGGGDDEAYLHECDAPSWAAESGLWDDRFYSEVRRCYFVPPPVGQLPLFTLSLCRNPVSFSHTHFVKTSAALRWVCVTLLVRILWASRVWALPFLSTLAHSECDVEEQGKRHKKLTERAAQLLLLVRCWHPEREIVAVAEGTYCSSLKLFNRR